MASPSLLPLMQVISASRRPPGSEVNPADTDPGIPLDFSTPPPTIGLLEPIEATRGALSFEPAMEAEEESGLQAGPAAPIQRKAKPSKRAGSEASYQKARKPRGRELPCQLCQSRIEVVYTHPEDKPREPNKVARRASVCRKCYVDMQQCPQDLPKCGKNTVKFINGIGMFRCKTCRSTFSIQEICRNVTWVLAPKRTGKYTATVQKV